MRGARYWVSEEKMSALAYEQRMAVLRGELAVGPGSGTLDVPTEFGGGQICLPPVGTLALIRHSSLAGKLVALGTRSRWSHAAMYVGNVKGMGPAVLEAESRGAVVTPLAKYARQVANGTVAEFGWVLEDETFLAATTSGENGGWALTEDDVREQVASIGLAMIGTPYSWPGVVAIGLMQFGIRIGWARKRVRRLDEAFCSQLYAVACLGAGVRALGEREIWDVSPGDLGRGRAVWDLRGHRLMKAGELGRRMCCSGKGLETSRRPHAVL